MNDLSTNIDIVKNIKREVNYNDLYQLTFPDVDREFKHKEFWKKHSLRNITDCLQRHRIFSNIEDHNDIFALARYKISLDLMEYYNTARHHTIRDYTKARLPLFARNMFSFHSSFRDYL